MAKLFILVTLVLSFLVAGPSSRAEIPKECRINRILNAYRRNDVSENHVLRTVTQKIKCVGKNYGAALEILGQLKSSPVSPDSIVFCAAMNACAAAAKPEKALELFEEMKGLGIPPGLVGYSTLMDAYSKVGKPDEVLAHFLDMQRQGITPDVIAYNIVIHAFGRVGLADEAARFLEEMPSETPPNIGTYNSVLNGYIQAGRYEEVFKRFVGMKKGKIFPNVVSYTIAIHACAKAGKSKLAFEIFDEMKRNQVVPNLITYNTLIDTCAESGFPVLAESLFQELLRKGLAPGIVSWNSMIKAYVQAGRMNLAYGVFQKMKEWNVEPNLLTYTLMISGCVNVERWDKAIEIFELALGSVIRRDVLKVRQLDLHSNSFFTAKTFSEEVSEGRESRAHPAGAPRELALVALRLREDHFPSSIVVGKNGQSVLKTAVAEFLEANQFTWIEEVDGGRFRQIQKKRN